MKIIATDIANLTDARYFAAWGVEGLAYNIDPLSDNSLTSAELKEIADWVEGPATMLKIDGLEVPETLSDFTSNINVKNIIIGPYIDAVGLVGFEKIFRICTLEDGWQDNDHLILVIPHEISTISETHKEKIIRITSNKNVYLDANFSANDLVQITNLGFSGIILKGGEEEKVGYKSYDKLDEILEAIFE